MCYMYVRCGGWVFFKCSFVGKYVGYFVTRDAHMGPDFVYVYRVWGPVDLVDCGGY